MPHRPPRKLQVAVALIERRGRYLICRRRPGSHLAGCWEFPGGKRRAGEPWRACLHREIAEELGVRVTRVSPVGALRYRYPDRSISFRVFRCALVKGHPKPFVHKELRWVPSRQLSRYRFPPANGALVRYLKDGCALPKRLL